MASGQIERSIFIDVNQSARDYGLLNIDRQKLTLIADRVATKVAKNPGKPLPNGIMGNAHAEVGTIQQAFDAGVTDGAHMTMRVTKQAVCSHCIGDIPVMANKAGLKSLTIFQEANGKTLFWKPGMKSLQHFR